LKNIGFVLILYKFYIFPRHNIYFNTYFLTNGITSICFSNGTSVKCFAYSNLDSQNISSEELDNLLCTSVFLNNGLLWTFVCIQVKFMEIFQTLNKMPYFISTGLNQRLWLKIYTRNVKLCNRGNMLYTSVHHIIQVVLESSLDAKKKQILLIITKSKKLLGFINL